MAKSFAILLLFGNLGHTQDTSDGNWTQAAGPDGNWTVTTQQPVPLQWSVERSENIRWRTTLPESGQSGIAVWEDRLFLTTMKPLRTGATQQQGTDIVLYCVSAEDGGILWQQDLAGDPQAKNFDQSALVSCNDLGGFGETWSCNTPSYSLVRLYHRTMKELLCIEAKR